MGRGNDIERRERMSEKEFDKKIEEMNRKTAHLVWIICLSFIASVAATILTLGAFGFLPVSR